MQKLAIFRKVKEIKELRGGVQVVRRTSNSAGWRRDCGKGQFLDGHYVVSAVFMVINTRFGKKAA